MAIHRYMFDRPSEGTLRALLLACLCAALTPVLLDEHGRTTSAAADEPHWPAHFQGRMLSELPLGDRERVYLAGFPGAVRRLTDGERDLVMRWVTQPTRQLHPAEDCYRGLGYEISEPRVVNDSEGAQWRCFNATRDGDARDVCEHLQDGEGQRWTDVSAWYWAALLKRSAGPWLVTTASMAVER